MIDVNGLCSAIPSVKWIGHNIEQAKAVA